MYDGELERFRRRFAEMQQMLDGLGNAPTGPEAVQALGEVRAFMHGERGALTPVMRLVVADLYYLDGYTQEQIGTMTEVTKAAVSATLLTGGQGPGEYVAVRRTSRGQHRLERVAVKPDRAGSSYKRLAEMREQGWRVAPAVWQVDPETVDAAELWNRLGEMPSDT